MCRNLGTIDHMSCEALVGCQAQRVLRYVSGCYMMHAMALCKSILNLIHILLSASCFLNPCSTSLTCSFLAFPFFWISPAESFPFCSNADIFVTFGQSRTFSKSIINCKFTQAYVKFDANIFYKSSIFLSSYPTFSSNSLKDKFSSESRCFNDTMAVRMLYIYF